MSDQNPTQPLDSGNGFIVGTDPPQGPRDSSWSQVPLGGTNTNGTTITVPSGGQGGAGYGGRVFTAEEVEAIRREEKEKLYGRIDTLDEELKVLRKEREERVKAEKDRKKAEEEAARAKEEEGMELRALLDRRDAEWRQRFDSLEQERERDRAVFEQERRMTELDVYRRNRLEQTAGEIAPQLRDFVAGNTEQEIEASIARMIQKTQEIMAEIAGAIPTPAPPPPVGVTPTAPPVGPMEQLQTTQSFSPDDIRHMDMDTYRKYRDGLLTAASRQYRGG